MNKTVIRYTFLFLFLSSFTYAVAQTDSIAPNSEFPSLDVFIESALTNSPLLKISDKQLSQIFEQIKKEKKSWTDFFYVEANTRYGLYNQISISGATDNQDQANDAILNSNKQQFNYYFGLSLKIPISKIMNGKNEMKILNENFEEKKLQKQEVIDQLKRLVTEEYFNLSYLNKSMKINQDMLQAFTISLMKSEKDLQSGLISLEQYNTMIVQKGKVEDSFYKIQNDYFAQYKKLEILTGYKGKETK